MKLTIYHNETAQEVMEQLKFILMEFGVVLGVEEIDKESTTYTFTPAPPLESDER